MDTSFLYRFATNEETAIEFLQNHNVLRRNAPNCPTCGRLMTLVKSGRGEERIFRCPSHKGEKVYLSKDTYFENSKLSYKKIVELLFFWSISISLKHTVTLTGIAEKKRNSMVSILQRYLFPLVSEQPYANRWPWIRS